MYSAALLRGRFLWIFWPKYDIIGASKQKG